MAFPVPLTVTQRARFSMVSTAGPGGSLAGALLAAAICVTLRDDGDDGEYLVLNLLDRNTLG